MKETGIKTMRRAKPGTIVGDLTDNLIDGISQPPYEDESIQNP